MKVTTIDVVSACKSNALSVTSLPASKTECTTSRQIPPGRAMCLSAGCARWRTQASRPSSPPHKTDQVHRTPVQTSRPARPSPAAAPEGSRCGIRTGPRHETPAAPPPRGRRRHRSRPRAAGKPSRPTGPAEARSRETDWRAGARLTLRHPEQRESSGRIAHSRGALESNLRRAIGQRGRDVVAHGLADQSNHGRRRRGSVRCDETSRHTHREHRPQRHRNVRALLAGCNHNLRRGGYSRRRRKVRSSG